MPLVAGLIELVGLEDAAAPDAQHINIGGLCLLDPRGITLGVTRGGKQSSGIQLAPQMKSGTSLMTKVKAEPCSSAEVSSRSERKPSSR